ncbi:MAG TPA: alpha/beta hydrolase [Caulobacteraceae bacterium]|jgi:acetyl esterase/lipase|nr:alpha/beta hydrolase [Caulobacteraceae bacterium]
MQPSTPDTVSAEAIAAMAALQAGAPPTEAPSLEQTRAFADGVQVQQGEAQLRRFGVTTRQDEIAGVPVRTFTPPGGAPPADGAVLFNLHGGGFVVDSGSMTENIALAAATGLPVVSALYRLAPEHPFPAAVDDALAVYAALLRERPASRIGLYGTSAGAVLSAQLLQRVRDAGLAMPAALGFFSGSADMARDGDSETYSPRVAGGSLVEVLAPYAGDTPRRLPALSPIFGDLGDYPPTLVLSSTRDPLLSHSAMFHRALLAAGREAELIVFERLPHAFWAYIEAPETDEAFAHMSRFLLACLDRAG